MKRPAQDQTPSRLPLYLGVVLVAVGWVVIGLGWYQAGRQDLETGQLPYVISGGFGGFGLLLMGVVAILADVVRQAESKLRRSADELHTRMEQMAQAFVEERAQGARSARRTVDGEGTKSSGRRRRRPRPAGRQQDGSAP